MVLNKILITKVNDFMWHSYCVLFSAGDMFDEDALLEWLIDNKDKGPASIIEEVDGKMLQTLVDTFEYLVVYFCEWGKGIRWIVPGFLL